MTALLRGKRTSKQSTSTSTSPAKAIQDMVLTNVMKMNNVDVDLFIHDDVCHFESYIKKRRYSQFDSVKYYIVDVFHAPNHLCSKRKWTPREKKRCKLVRTNIAESFNAWIRSLNFFVNGLRPHSHRFWIREACDFYSANLKDVPIRISRRTSVLSRSAKVAKRPSSRNLKKPSGKCNSN